MREKQEEMPMIEARSTLQTSSRTARRTPWCGKISEVWYNLSHTKVKTYAPEALRLSMGKPQVLGKYDNRLINVVTLSTYSHSA